MKCTFVGEPDARCVRLLSPFLDVVIDSKQHFCDYCFDPGQNFGNLIFRLLTLSPLPHTCVSQLNRNLRHTNCEMGLDSTDLQTDRGAAVGNIRPQGKPARIFSWLLPRQRLNFPKLFRRLGRQAMVTPDHPKLLRRGPGPRQLNKGI